MQTLKTIVENDYCVHQQDNTGRYFCLMAGSTDGVNYCGNIASQKSWFEITAFGNPFMVEGYECMKCKEMYEK